ncbi:exonuclease [Clostridium sp. M62/1]|uniref:hypothetical protein n=1 Tax=Clostridium sp. M62/1 TaxID=411486 RepID=UPI00019734DE|nr:hypothetical protein [Clostridium sp. M62/1]EFE13428.1 hypothetical protein CLOM621_06582 [Clostridium sp. M62/1]MBS5467733.1 exonuclease [Clostridium sp.]UEB79527.1 exonuclease [Clostridium sp. M62/1]
MEEKKRETKKGKPDGISGRSVRRKSLDRYSRAEFLRRLIEAGILKRDTGEGEKKSLQEGQAVCKRNQREGQKTGREASL